VRDSPFCFWHDPGKAEELADAQRLGGMRRREERSLAVAYDFTGLGTIESIRRLFEIAATDALGLETSIAKIRAIVQVGAAAMKLLETGALADRQAALERLLAGQKVSDDVDLG
jgi:hypothetical protein